MTGTTDLTLGMFDTCTTFVNTAYNVPNMKKYTIWRPTVISISDSEIANSKYMGCTSLRTVIIRSTVTSIGQSAFIGCTSLNNVTFEGASTLNVINEYAFQGCTSLTSINFPSSLSTIKTGAFLGCNSLKSLNNRVFQLSGISSYSSIFQGTSIKTFTITSPSTGFSDISAMTAVSNAFGSCHVPVKTSQSNEGSNIYVSYNITALTEVIISSNVISIASYQYLSCRSLASVVIPSSVTSIGSYSFSG